MRILYIGTGEIGVPSLKALLGLDEFEIVGLVTQPDKPAGRKQELKLSATKILAIKNSIKVFQPEKINKPEALDVIRELNPDLAVVCAYGQILKKEMLDLPKLGCLNIHASLLPAYRGAACIQEAIRRGDTQTGVTIMWMDEGLDTGDILLKGELNILETDTAGSLHDRLAELAPELLIEALQQIKEGIAPRIAQNDEVASYVSRLKKEDGRVDWSQSANAICDHVRAMTPWPTAFTTFDSEDGSKKMLKLFDVKIHHTGDVGCKPGVVMEADGEALIIGTGDGSVQVGSLQMEGRKRMSVRNFLLGQSLKKEMRLGSKD